MPRPPDALRYAALAALLAWSCNTGATGPAAVPYPNTDGFGIAFEQSEEWYRHCMRALRPEPPRAPASRARMRCDASELYYRKRDQNHATPAEWRQVRSCAEASGDDAVLMMLHANGYGTARDTEQALYYACKLDTAKAEMEGRVAYLASPAAASDALPFDLCDHVTSERMVAMCAGIQENRAARVRDLRLARFAAGLPPAARRPFARLREAATAFNRSAAGEVDLRGGAGAGLSIRHAGRRDNEFMETLLAAANGQLPRANAAQLAEIDRELKWEYRKAMAAPSGQEQHPQRGGATPAARAQVRKAERAWIAYRDAWGPFLAAANLRTDLASVKAALTRQHIAHVKRM